MPEGEGKRPMTQEMKPLLLVVAMLAILVLAVLVVMPL